MVPVGPESLVNQHNGSAVAFRSDHTARCLQYPIDPRIQVSKFEPGINALGVILSYCLALQTNRRQTDSDNGCTAEPISHQIDRFTEYPAHNRKPYQGIRVIPRKPGQKRASFLIAHIGPLHDDDLVL